MTVTSRDRAGSRSGRRTATHRDVVAPFVGEQATVAKSGMSFPDDLSERSWERIGTGLRELANSSSWWLGDWLVFGETAYGWQRYRQAIDRTGLDYQTLRNYAWVTRRFDHERRRDALSFAHHAEVARMAPPEQDYWLRQAEQQCWSRNELRRALRTSLAERQEEGEPRAEQQPREVTSLTIELSTGQLENYSRVAAAQGLPVDQWVTRVLDGVDRRTA